MTRISRRWLLHAGSVHTRGYTPGTFQFSPCRGSVGPALSHCSAIHLFIHSLIHSQASLRGCLVPGSSSCSLQTIAGLSYLCLPTLCPSLTSAWDLWALGKAWTPLNSGLKPWEKRDPLP